MDAFPDYYIQSVQPLSHSSSEPRHALKQSSNTPLATGTIVSSITPSPLATGTNVSSWDDPRVEKPKAAEGEAGGRSDEGGMDQGGQNRARTF